MAIYCTTGIGSYENADCLDPNPQDGGIKYLIVADADIEDYITDPTSATQWQDAIDNGQVEIVGPLLAEIPEASPNTQRTTSCAPAKTVQKARTLSFEDYNTSKENTEFYNDLIANSLGFKFGYVDCNDSFYGFLEDVSFDVTRIHEQENDTGTTKWVGSIAWNKLEEEVPTDFPTNIVFG